MVARLRGPDMWSGWGIRTLSERNPAYNPTSYHTGSVWPHDNGIIALGFRRYGFASEAAEIAHDIFEAATSFIGLRLPELYGGQRKEPGALPVLCPRANVPQAWAAGSVFHQVSALLGLEADAPRGRLVVDPVLPEWLPEITLRGVRVGKASVDLHCWRAANQTEWDAELVDGEIEVVPPREAIALKSG
jgi:glycogen debranching enzyme